MGPMLFADAGPYRGGHGRGGVRCRYWAERLQARMLASGEELDIAEVERFCERAGELFRASARPADPRGYSHPGITG